MSAKIAPAFPASGYLPVSLNQVLANRKLQQQEVDRARCDARQAGQPSPCVQVLNVSLFFDGTNNHGESDDRSNPISSSNIRRLYRASIGRIGLKQGGNYGYYSYYIQGVGTVFQEIGEPEPSAIGLAFAKGGEERILWGLTRVVDALRRSMSDQLDVVQDDEAVSLIRSMQYTYEIQDNDKGRDVKVLRQTTVAERQAVMMKALQSVLDKRQQDYKPRVLRIRLYVYGFSRGAAEARAFLWRLRELMDVAAGTLCEIPLSVEFAGLFDTVASVGSTELMPGGEGHAGWADDSMRLPPGFVARCEHLVSAHEQRLCFPLDSVATEQNGNYPSAASEWIYPGMHSDVGGGYPPGDQGKAREGQGMLLSQLPLLHMFQMAHEAGAPLQVDKSLLQDVDPEQLALLEESEAWRFMDETVGGLFVYKKLLLDRFEAWRAAAMTAKDLNAMLQFQTAQITAWRIARYAGGIEGKGGPGYRDADFYKHSKDTPPWQVDAQEDAWKKAGKRRSADKTPPGEVILQPPAGHESDGPQPYTPNIDKDYEPLRDRTQLREGAKDFSDDYTGKTTLSPNLFGGFVTFFSGLSRPFSDDCGQELQMLKEDGEGLYQAITGNALLMALYDEHIHDSRAWFMHATLGKREPHGTYLRYRTVFYTDGNSNKKPICEAPRAKEIKRQQIEESRQRSQNGI